MLSNSSFINQALIYSNMKKLFTLFLILSTLFVTAQTQPPSVENSLFGAQTGFLGVWVHNESRLSNSIALRTEIGLDSNIFGGSAYEEDVNFLLTPVLTLEPRWYYNLDKRQSKGKSISNNSGNFFALRISFNPDLFVISNDENVSVSNQLFVIPKWAIRRNIGEHFNYELGIGIGYHHIFDEDYQKVEDDDETIAVDFHIRIGYTF